MAEHHLIHENHHHHHHHHHHEPKEEKQSDQEVDDISLQEEAHLNMAHMSDISDNSDYSKTSIANLIGVHGKEGLQHGIIYSPDGNTLLSTGETVIIDGVTYNSRGYEVCGQLNQHSKPCQRIGRCPFHSKQKEMSNGISSPIDKKDKIRPPPIKKAPYKQGWTKEEHIRFLNGLQLHGKGAWKEIAVIVGTRSPTQIQSHAQKYYLRQKQEVKNKRSIHDLSLAELSETDASLSVISSNSQKNINVINTNNSPVVNMNNTRPLYFPYSSMLMSPQVAPQFQAQTTQAFSPDQLGMVFSPGTLVGTHLTAGPGTLSAPGFSSLPPPAWSFAPAHPAASFPTNKLNMFGLGDAGFGATPLSLTLCGNLSTVVQTQNLDQDEGVGEN